MSLKVLITGGGGFVGTRLAEALLSPESEVKPTELVLTDIFEPKAPTSNPRKVPVKTLKGDICDANGIASVISKDIDLVFMLHGIMSGGSEENFDLGMQVNLYSIQKILEHVRHNHPGLKMVYTSSVGAFGGDDLPDIMEDMTALKPQISYGMEKAVCELLIDDYSRRGWVDGRTVRLPTISVRAGTPSSAASSYVSGIIREPLKGETSNCPVPVDDFYMYVCSPQVVVRNIIHAAVVNASEWGKSRAITLPGISVTVKQMLNALERVAGPEPLKLITYKEEPLVWKIASGWPGKFNAAKAKRLGMLSDRSFEENIRLYMEEEGIKAKA